MVPITALPPMPVREPPRLEVVTPLMWLGGAAPSTTGTADEELLFPTRIVDSIASPSVAGDCASISEFVDNTALDALRSLEEEDSYPLVAEHGQWL